MKIKTIQPFNHSTVQQVKEYAFTLAETLIVIGIIGVVAALTLPNLNHATGDKETVTRLKKAYSALTEATDRAIAVYGDISEWKNQPDCKKFGRESFDWCYMKRLSEFLKVKKICDLTIANVDIEECISEHDSYTVALLLSDDMAISCTGGNLDCNGVYKSINGNITDVCVSVLDVDINGPHKGRNEGGYDTFEFIYSTSKGLLPRPPWTGDSIVSAAKNSWEAAYWVLNFENLDYLKTDSSFKCNDNPSIILDGVTNTSCH